MEPDFTKVTEVSGEDVSREQIQRMFARYHFALEYCQNKEVLELACGCGQGLGYIGKRVKKIVGGDYSAPLLRQACNHYQGRVPLVRLDAQVLPFKNQSFDVIILYEAIYYLPEVGAFFRECRRILRPQGTLLICTANKSLPDFNPSPYSYKYFSPGELLNLLAPLDFQVGFFGGCPVDYGSFKQRALSWIKKTMVRLDLMPKTMRGKKLFKRLVFGKLVPLPAELQEGMASPEFPRSIPSDREEHGHKVIFIVAQL